MTERPKGDEAAEYYFKYIDLVPDGDIVRTLAAQHREMLPLLRGISQDTSAHRYAPGKWTIRQVLSHVIDCERLFVFRALWFARGFETPLPSFDQEIAIAADGAEARTWESLVGEFDAVRAGSTAFFSGLPRETWDRRGIASGFPFSVRALAFLTVGHVVHHAAIIRSKYL
jgi:uncharacterized damage-inducible protein DinB